MQSGLRIYFSEKTGEFVDRKYVNKIKYIIDLFKNACFARFMAPDTNFVDIILMKSESAVAAFCVASFVPACCRWVQRVKIIQFLNYGMVPPMGDDWWWVIGQPEVDEEINHSTG